MTFRLVLLISFFTATLSVQTAFGQRWQERFDLVESLIESEQTDSARLILRETVTLVESEYGRSDSTVDIEFWRDGVSFRRYFRSFSDAERFYAELTSVSEKVYGSSSLEFGLHLRKLGAVYVTLGKYWEAKATYRRALAIVEAIYGPDSEETVPFLTDLSDVLYILAEYEEADSLAHNALGGAERIMDMNHPSVARNLQIIGKAQWARDAETKAEPLLERSLAIRENHLGPDHPDVAKSLCLLGMCYESTNKTEEAETVLTRSLEIQKAAFGPEHPEVALVLLNLASIHNDAKGRELADFAVSALEKTYGPNHPQTATAILTLANYLDMVTGFEETLAKAQQALPVLKETLGDNHPHVALAYETIGFTKFQLSQFAEAADALKKAEEILLARANPNILLSHVLFNLYMCYANMGLEAKADSAMDRFHSMVEKAGDTRFAADISVTLGMLYLSKGRTADARASLSRALDISNKIGNDDINLKMLALRTLAMCYVVDREYDKAENFACEVLPLSERLYGSDSDIHGITLNMLADIYMLQGKFGLAKKTFLKGLRNYAQGLAPDSWGTTRVLRSLGAICGATGEYDESLKFFKRLLDTKQRMIHIVFGSSSETQKVWQVSQYPVIFNEIFSLALICGTDEALEMALEISLKEKAIVEEASMVERQIAYCQQDDEIKNQLNLLKQVRTELAMLAPSGGCDPDSLMILYGVIDSLETELSRECSEFKDELALRDFEISDVAAKISEGAVLLEFIKYHPVTFDSTYFADYFESSDEPRYVGLTVDADESISINDLGPADTIDSLITLAREMIYDAHGMIHSAKAALAEEMLTDVTSELRELVIDPLSDQLGGVTSLYISPDGMLNLLPFEILPLSDGSYAIEKYQISYLSSGRDLLRYPNPAQRSNEVLVMADPDFEREAMTTAQVSIEPVTAENEDLPISLVSVLRGTGGCLQGLMGRLDYSRMEGQQVAGSFRRHSQAPVVELYGRQASEGNLKGLEAPPGVLHLATHGYFCPYSDELSEYYENPLLRSGLVLAGYNHTFADDSTHTRDSEDGILTAFEVSGLNLSKTDLVTLSACESGLAEGYTCEGLYGLRRAFQHAGAQSVIMSLWRVPDRETKLLMGSFYDRWLSGSSKREALRQAALEVLRTCREELGCGHPQLWGGFILTGNPN